MIPKNAGSMNTLEERITIVAKRGISQHEDMSEARLKVAGASERHQKNAEINYVEYKGLYDRAFKRCYENPPDIYDEEFFMAEVTDIPAEIWEKRIIFTHLLNK